MGQTFSNLNKVTNTTLTTVDKTIGAAGDIAIAAGQTVTALGQTMGKVGESVAELSSGIAQIPTYLMTIGKWVVIGGGVLIGGVVIVWGVMAIKGDAHKALGAVADGVGNAAKIAAVIK
jgi:hypothetical protein